MVTRGDGHGVSSDSVFLRMKIHLGIISFLFFINLKCAVSLYLFLLMDDVNEVCAKEERMCFVRCSLGDAEYEPNFEGGKVIQSSH